MRRTEKNIKLIKNMVEKTITDLMKENMIPVIVDSDLWYNKSLANFSYDQKLKPHIIIFIDTHNRYPNNIRYNKDLDIHQATMHLNLITLTIDEIIRQITFFIMKSVLDSAIFGLM